jgi:hypothetical protein
MWRGDAGRWHVCLWFVKRKYPAKWRHAYTICKLLTDWYVKKLKLSHYTPRRRLGKKRYSSYSFTTSALDTGEWSASRPCRGLSPWKGPSGTHCTGGWVGPRAGLDTEVRGKILSPLPGIEPRSFGRSVRSQTLYWLSYPAQTDNPT